MAYSTSLLRTTVPSLINDILVRVCSVVVVSVYHLKLISLSQFVFCNVLIYGVQMAMVFIYVWWIDKPGIIPDREKFSREEIASMLRFGIILSFAILSSIGLKEVSVIIIGKYLPLAQAGIYSIAAFIPLVIEAPLNALDRIVQPKTSSAWAANNLGEIKTIYVKSSRYLLLIGGLIFLGINLNIESLMKLLPQDYSMGIPVVIIISLGSVFNLATGLNDAIIYYSEKYLSGIYLLVIMFVLAITLNIILIPAFGLTGAAIATAGASLAYNILKFIFIRKNFSLQPFDMKTLKIIAVIIIVWLIIHFVPAISFPIADIIIRSLFIITLYCGIIYFWKIVPELEPVILSYLKKITGRSF
jgi:O-antigen/teichoic acid export membrane protein